MITWKHIRGILYQEWHITRRSLEVIIDIPFFSFIGVLLFGYVSQAFLGTLESEIGKHLIMGSLLWEVLRISQYSMTVSSFWNLWSRNLSNMFISPLTLNEFLLAQMASSIIKAAGVMLFLIPLATALFHFNLFSLSIGALTVIFVNILLFAWSVGLILLGCVFRFGMRVQALGWGLIFIFQPLCGVFYPMSIIPEPLHSLAFIFPLTYIFEGARATLATGSMAWEWQLPAFILSAAYFILSIILFRHLLHRAQDTGQFARNES